jgi:hypothetical protein
VAVAGPADPGTGCSAREGEAARGAGCGAGAGAGPDPFGSSSGIALYHEAQPGHFTLPAIAWSGARTPFLQYGQRVKNGIGCLPEGNRDNHSRDVLWTKSVSRVETRAKTPAANYQTAAG